MVCPYLDLSDNNCIERMCTDAHEYIHTLQEIMEEQEQIILDQYAELDVLPRWIPVTERLPEDGKNVIVFVRSCADWWTMDIDWCVNGHWVINADDEWHNITHWMPLPSVPKEAS